MRTYGFGVVDLNGKPYFAEDCLHGTFGQAQQQADDMNEDEPERQWRAVELRFDFKQK
jgi:hypothetical protein